MAILNLKGNNGVKRMTVAGKIELGNGLNTYFLKQDQKNKYLFCGVISENKKENPDKNVLTWNIKTHDKLTMRVNGASKADVPAINEIEIALTNHILERETLKKSDFSKLYTQAKSFRDESIIEEEVAIEGDDVKVKNNIIETAAKDEVVITKLEKPSIPKKPEVSDAVKAFMKEYGTTKLVESLELAVAKYNDVLNDIALLEERLANAKPELTKEEIQDIVMDNIPSEYIDALEKVNSEPEDPDDDPKGGQPVPAFDVAEFKTQLKAEIIAELKEELKASSASAVEEPKKTTGVKLPTPIESPVIKKEEIKKEEPKTEKKKIKTSELTMEDLNSYGYKTLQKIGSKLGLGIDNVAKKQDLINIIAAKLKIAVNSGKEEAAIEKETLNITKGSSKYADARASIDYAEDVDGIEEDFNLDVEKEVSAVDELVGKTFEDPAKQRLADLVLSRRK